MVCCCVLISTTLPNCTRALKAVKKLKIDVEVAVTNYATLFSDLLQCDLRTRHFYNIAQNLTQMFEKYFGP